MNEKKEKTLMDRFEELKAVVAKLRANREQKGRQVVRFADLSMARKPSVYEGSQTFLRLLCFFVDAYGSKADSHHIKRVFA
jgi:hypothetical protein